MPPKLLLALLALLLVPLAMLPRLLVMPLLALLLLLAMLPRLLVLSLLVLLLPLAMLPRLLLTLLPPLLLLPLHLLPPSNKRCSGALAPETSKPRAHATGLFLCPSHRGRGHSGVSSARRPVRAQCWLHWPRFRQRRWH